MEMFLAPLLSQRIRFARVCSNVDDIKNRNLFLTAKLLKQGYRYNKFEKHFLNSTTNIGLKTLLQQGMAEPIFFLYCFGLKIQKNCWKPNFSDQLKNIIKRY